MLLDTDRDKNIDLIGEKMSIFCRTHIQYDIAVGYRIQGGSPGRLRLRYAVVRLHVEMGTDAIENEAKRNDERPQVETRSSIEEK